jgi:hypothetical protein
MDPTEAIIFEDDPSKVLQDPVYELTAEQEAEAAEWRARGLQGFCRLS